MSQSKIDYPYINWLNIKIIIFSGFALLTLLYYFLGYLDYLDNRIVGIDSVYYFSYLRSFIFDGDFNFTNELAQLYPAGVKSVSELGIPRNNFSIGPAIFWLPFYGVAHLLTLINQWFGGDLSPDGYSSLYQLSVTIANSFYLVLGLVFALKTLKLYVSPSAALFTIFSLLFASQLTYYIWLGSAMSHNVSFAATSIYLFLLLTRGATSLTALIAALMVLARWQNAILLLPIFFTFLYGMARSIKAKDLKWASILKKHFYFGIIMFIGLLPQFIAWKMIFGHYLLIPQGGGFFELNLQAIFAVLFDLHHGLFSWHPILFIGLFGLVLFYKKQRLMAGSFLLIFIAQLVLNASVNDWWAGWSFGHRRFISLLPLFAIGLALVFNAYKNTNFRIGLTVVAIVLSIWNQLFIYQYHHALIPRGDTITRTQMFNDKFHLPRLTLIQKHLLKSIKFLSDEDIKNMKLQANLAYQIDTSHNNSLLVNGLACLLTEDVDQGKKVFLKWYEQDQSNLLAKYGLAHHLILEKNIKSASKLFEPSNCLQKDSKLCQSLKSKINQNSLNILDMDFWNLYRDELDKLYTN